jgi:RNA 3'-terminal phosphate cyclase (ATP)
MIEIDGTTGEGGGQILRSAVSLSAITGKPFRIFDIRARRKNPGIQKQHLQSILAAQQACDGLCRGAQLGSTELEFQPDGVEAGHYEFDIKSAGSTTLVFQTVLPILFQADELSTIVIKGGTHNPMAPPFEFLRDSFLPVLSMMGYSARPEFVKHGFYPSGGGEIAATIDPVLDDNKKNLSLIERGEIKTVKPKIIVSNLPLHIAEREREVIKESLWCSDDDVEIEMVPAPASPGNVVIITAEMDDRSVVFSSIGEKRKRAEVVAKEALGAYWDWYNSRAAVCKYLADQLLLYMAMNGGGEFTTNDVTDHLTTNAGVIRMFIDVDINVEKLGADLFKVSVKLK